MIILYLFLTSILLVVIVVLVYRNNIDIHETEKKNIEKIILEARLEILEQTFKNISREIHDNIGQTLSLVKLNISTLDCEEPNVFHEKMDSSKVLISQSVQDLRDLSKGINPDYVIEMGLMRSIEYELELIKKTGSFETLFSIEGKPYRLEQQKELILFRIVQEILHNIIKHAKAALINVQVHFELERFSLTIIDDGIGFDIRKLEENNNAGLGLGIRNMRNRAKMINTDFTLNSIPEKGTEVTLTLPLEIQKK